MVQCAGVGCSLDKPSREARSAGGGARAHLGDKGQRTGRKNGHGSTDAPEAHGAKASVSAWRPWSKPASRVLPDNSADHGQATVLSGEVAYENRSCLPAAWASCSNVHIDRRADDRRRECAVCCARPVHLSKAAHATSWIAEWETPGVALALVRFRRRGRGRADEKRVRRRRDASVGEMMREASALAGVLRHGSVLLGREGRKALTNDGGPPRIFTYRLWVMRSGEWSGERSAADLGDPCVLGRCSQARHGAIGHQENPR